MKEIITAYLYEHKNCPLPSLGSLQLRPGHAKFLPGENRMLAPKPFIELVDDETATYGLVNFIAAEKKISELDASALLGNYCGRLKQLPEDGESALGDAGSFYMDANGKLHFRSPEIAPAFLPEVKAERVIHLDVAHEMLVGDTQTNTAAMTEMLREENIARSRWWIAALVFALTAAGIIFYYYSQHTAGDTGNAVQVLPGQAPKTYITGQ
jgi:hypothetical protein